MANTDNPRGFKYVSQLKGGDPTVAEKIKDVSDTVVLGRGDFVDFDGTADGVKRVAAQGVILGTSLSFGAASTLTTHPVLLAWDDTLFEAQEDSVGGALAADDEQLNADIVVANANTTTGRGQMEIDSNTASTTASLDLKIWELSKKQGNAIGTNAIWNVLVNDRRLASLVAGV